MNGKIGARVSRVFGDGGSQGREIRKFFFVPQFVQELDAHEFTVSIGGAIETSYVTTASDLGSTMRFVVTGRNDYGTSLGLSAITFRLVRGSIRVSTDRLAVTGPVVAWL